MLLGAIPAGGQGPRNPTTLWIAVLLVTQLLELSNARTMLVDAETADESFREFRASLASDPVAHGHGVVLDEDWDLWEGTLESNVLGEDGLTFCGSSMLAEEFGTTTEFAAVYVARAGKNVSLGSGFRILLARAIQSAILGGERRVVVDRLVASIDDGLLAKVDAWSGPRTRSRRAHRISRATLRSFVGVADHHLPRTFRSRSPETAGR